MTILVTGSAGHLGEGIMRALRADGVAALGLDVNASPYTDAVGSIVDPGFVRECMSGVDAVLHTATLHKPHVVTHRRRQFVDTNVVGTLNLLESAVANSVKSFVFTSTTSAFGRALSPDSGEPAAWVTEELVPRPKNIYGTTKTAAEDLCELFHLREQLPCLVLRTSRFFPEEDDRREVRESYEDANAKANEFLYRRADLEDIVAAHRLAIERAPELGFRKFIVSATTPFQRGDVDDLRRDAAAVVERYFPEFPGVYAERGWKMFPEIERVYSNERARSELGWRPRFDFGEILRRVQAGEPLQSELARAVGAKGYHSEKFDEGPYPVE